MSFDFIGQNVIFKILNIFEFYIIFGIYSHCLWRTLIYVSFFSTCNLIFFLLVKNKIKLAFSR